MAENLIQIWLEKLQEVERAKNAANIALNVAQQLAKPPTNRRKATADEIKPGLILWHEDGDDGWFWQVVEEVFPETRDKGIFRSEFPGNIQYQALDGCCYRIDDAYIEVKNEN